MIRYAHHALNGADSLFHLYINYLNFYNCICTRVHICVQILVATFDFQKVLYT